MSYQKKSYYKKPSLIGMNIGFDNKENSYSRQKNSIMIIYHPFNGYGGSQLMAKNLMEIFKKSSQNENLFCIVGFGMEGFIKADKVLFDISNKYLRILSLGILSFFLNFYFRIIFSLLKIIPSSSNFLFWANFPPNK